MMAWALPRTIAPILAAHHYLGAIDKGIAWQDRFGVIVVGAPTARNLPPKWLELTRWCITSTEKNSGSQQWSAFVRALRKISVATTIVSYSDPSAGHTGALYRACNWLWAPTWHRLRPPPSGNGRWEHGRKQAVKDRWVFLLRADAQREAILLMRDESLLRKYEWARYREPGGVPYKRLQEVA